MVAVSDRVKRLRELVETLLGKEPEDGASSEVDEVDGWRARLRESSLVQRLLSTRGPDQVTALGEVVHLQIPIARLARLRATRWQVRVGDEVVLDRPLEPEDDGVVMVQPRSSGCFEVVAQMYDRHGSPVVEFISTPALLQVIDDRPTVLVDVELLRTDESAVRQLRALSERGHAWVYFDVFDHDRTAELREEFRESRAPEAAILVHTDDAAEIPTLGVDFRPVFLTASLRRLRGAGIPVVAVISGRDVASVAAARAGVEHYATLGAIHDDVGRHAGSIHAEPRPLALAGRLDRTTRTRAVDGNACEVEFDNRRGRLRLFAAIEGASQTVHLQYYMIRDGVFGDQLAARLIRAARRGVRVRLLVDALYSVDGVAGATNAVARGLMEVPGIDVVSSTPITSREDLGPRVLKQRDHRKIVVVDGQLAFVGGRNACDEYYTGFDEVAITDWTPHARIPWLDAHVEVRGPLVGGIARAFVTRWVQAGGRRPPGGVGAIVDPPAVGPSRARLVLHEGIDDAAALLAYESLIDGARDHLWIVNDFPIVPSLRLALRRALHRGVAIRILTGCAVPRRADGTFFDGPLHREAFEHMTKKRLEGLMRAGAEVWEYVAPPHPLIVCRGGVVRPYVHAKVVSVDGRVVSVGSANLDATASYWEREANVVVEDPAVAGRVETELARMCDRGVRVDPGSDQWRREGLQREVASQLWPEALYS